MRLLNISLSVSLILLWLFLFGVKCHVNDTSKDSDEAPCNKDACISAVGNFFFTPEGDFEFTSKVRLDCLSSIQIYILCTIQVYECCEHEDACDGFPEHIYSPWNCLHKDPFYSCNTVRGECLNETEGDRGCKTNYQNFIRSCPEHIYTSDDCNRTDDITSECIAAARELEGDDQL